jgi:cyclopropane-fatty-acyl-phospholipid synthase
MQAQHIPYPGDALARPASPLQKVLLSGIVRHVGPLPVAFSIGDSAPVAPSGVTSHFHLKIRDTATALSLLLDPEVGFGDAWTEGRVALSGDLVEFLDTVYRAMAASGAQTGWLWRIVSECLAARQRNSIEGSRRNIHSHYDLGNEFYRRWLDRQMVYTCAYFPEETATLEEAQAAKMERVCRKLRLRPGESVVEAGCGWGALALHMARHYGVRVTAFNISREQIAFARERAREEGFGDRILFVQDDYRNAAGRFDVFVSVGMLEHVGRANYQSFGELIHRLVGDKGRGLLHFIGRNRHGEFSRWMRRRIFPGAYAPSLREALDVLEPGGFFVKDVENLRPHYVRTLEHWLERFERSSAWMQAEYGDEFERAWRLYLAGSIAGFRAGTLQLFQVLFEGPECAADPWRRPESYAW